MGDYHMSELYFVWGNPWPLRNSGAHKGPAIHTFSDDDSAMRAAFGQYWTAMATAGDPNGQVARNAFSVPAWPAVAPDAVSGSLDGLAFMAMKKGPEAMDGLNDENCDFWDAFLGF